MIGFFKSLLFILFAFLIIICTQVIYALLLSDVDGKTYEFGMLRALGFNTYNIATAIFIHALFISLLALGLGLTMASIFNAIFRAILFEISKNEADYLLTDDSINLGIAFGILIPMLSNIFPIRKAFGSNLRTSLDVNHKHIGEFKLIFHNIAQMGLSVPQTVLALALIFFGFISYYGFPVAFITGDWKTLYIILNMILIAILLGILYLAQLLQPLLEKLMVHLSILFCCNRDKSMKILIFSNLKSHQNRNAKSALMITFVIAFIVFCGSAFYSLENLLVGVAEMSFGADLIATVPTDFLKYSKTKSYLDEKRIAHFLKQRIKVDEDVLDFTFVSQDLDVLLTHLGLTERL